MKKKGFTLVELLAVIVILAIIVLIAIPLIGNVIEKAKIGALENSVNGLVESANMYYANETIKGEIISGTTFDWVDGVQTSDKKLEYKGKVENGKLILYDAGEIAVCIDDTEHYAYKNKDTDEIISGVGTCKYDGTTGQFSSNSPTEELEKQIASTTAEAKDVLEGKTIYKTNGIVTGTMTNKAGTTTAATTITENGDNALITIPEEGHYDETSTISVPIETIKNEIDISLKKLGSISCAANSSCTYTIPSGNVVNNYLVACTGVNAGSASGAAGVSSWDNSSLSNQKVSASIAKMSYSSSLSNDKITITVSGGKISSSSNLAGTGGSFNPTFVFDIYYY